METRRLKYFVVLISERHFGRAANQLLISQSALTQQIQRLERDVGARLIDRSIVPFELTPAGTRLLRHARHVLEGMDEIEGLSAEARSGKVGRLRIGIVPSLLYSEVPAAIRAFRRRHPSVDVDIRLSPTDSLYDMLELAQLEVVFAYTRPAQGDLQSKVVYRDPYVVVLPSDHPLADAEAVDLRELSNEQILLSPRRHSTEAYDAILGACVDSGFAAHDITVERSSYTDQIGLVAAGMGISLLPERLSHLNVPGIRTVRLRSPVLESNVLLAWNADTADPTRDRFQRQIHDDFAPRPQRRPRGVSPVQSVRSPVPTAESLGPGR